MSLLLFLNRRHSLIEYVISFSLYTTHTNTHRKQQIVNTSQSFNTIIYNTSYFFVYLWLMNPIYIAPYIFYECLSVRACVHAPTFIFISIGIDSFDLTINILVALRAGFFSLSECYVYITLI